MKEKIESLAQKNKEYIVEMRREFHKNPEPSLHEVNTAKRIGEELTAMGIPCVAMADTGVVATIAGARQGKTVALRADIDALRLTEKSDVPYRSQVDGVMHACV